MKEKKIVGGRITKIEDAQPSESFFGFLRKSYNTEDYSQHVRKALEEGPKGERVPAPALGAIAGIDPNKNLWTAPPHLRVPIKEKATGPFRHLQKLTEEAIDYYTNADTGDEIDSEVAQLTAQLEAWNTQEIVENIGPNASPKSVFEYRNRMFKFNEFISPDQSQSQQQEQQPLIPEAFTTPLAGKRVLSDKTLKKSEEAIPSKVVRRGPVV